MSGPWAWTNYVLSDRALRRASFQGTAATVAATIVWLVAFDLLGIVFLAVDAWRLTGETSVPLLLVLGATGALASWVLLGLAVRAWRLPVRIWRLT